MSCHYGPSQQLMCGGTSGEHQVQTPAQSRASWSCTGPCLGESGHSRDGESLKSISLLLQQTSVRNGRGVGFNQMSLWSGRQREGEVAQASWKVVFKMDLFHQLVQMFLWIGILLSPDCGEHNIKMELYGADVLPWACKKKRELRKVTVRFSKQKKSYYLLLLYIDELLQKCESN